MLAVRLINDAIDDHIEWLRSFGVCRLAAFDRVRQSNAEGAACEALVARYLRACLDSIHPFEDLSFGGPDFRCTHRGQDFYVEVTSLATKAVEAALWVPDDPKWQGGCVGSISRILRSSVSDKVYRQCRQKDAPTLIAIGLLHSWASRWIDHSLVEDMLVSDVAYEPSVSPACPVPTKPGEFVTGLNNALFMAIEADGVAAKRRPVSGVVVFGLGIQPPNAVGVINGNACRPFDSRLLPQIQFAEAAVKDGRVSIHWHE